MSGAFMADFTLSLSLQEYLFTAGILVSFIGLIIALALSRKEISRAVRESGFGKTAALMLIVALLTFMAIEIFVVHPTQQIFFDDDIYLAMAQDLLHTGQAWMCNYGTPTACYSGGILHEPIGESFNLAIGFAVLGVSRTVAYDTGILLGAAAVIAVFFIALLMFKDRRIAFLSSAFMALSPIVLIWTMPTTSDLPTMTYSLIAVFCMLVFMRKKTIGTFALTTMSMALCTYMKVDAIAYVFVIPFMYVLLDGTSIANSLRDNIKLVSSSLMNTKALIVILVFIIAIAPEIIFVQQELGGGYGYAGTIVQNTCGNSPATIIPSSTMNLQNFEANVCSNVLFWFNSYASIPGYPITQPLVFTLFAVFGAASMYAVFGKRREFLAIFIWLAAFFVLYTAFYAGSVTYGVDWRFQLGLIAQVSIFSGFGAFTLLETSKIKLGKLGSGKDRDRPGGFRKIILYCAVLIIIAGIAYSLYTELPEVGLLPSQITQAQPARFDENFVFNESHLIPPECLVFSYDPTLFIVNNRSSTQLDTIYDKSELANYTSSYSCLVIDWGYWCYTPNNYCTTAKQEFKLSPIVTDTDTQVNQTFGFYLVNESSLSS